jgi:hypothetical protein
MALRVVWSRGLRRIVVGLPAPRTEQEAKLIRLKLDRLLEDDAWSRRALAPPTNGPRTGRLHSQLREKIGFQRCYQMLAE